MPPQVRTSFIPKKQIIAGPAVSSGGVGLLFLVSLIIFVGSIVLGGGAFAYQKYLSQSIQSKGDSLARARAAFEPATIQDLTRLDKRLTQVHKLLDSHTAPSSIFDLLAATTLSSIAYTQFDFSVGPDGKNLLKLHGKAPAFDAVALQSDQMNTLRMLHDVIYSGFAVSKEGIVDFDVNATIDPALTNYRTVLQAGGINTSAPSSIQGASQPGAQQNKPTPNTTNTKPAVTNTTKPPNTPVKSPNLVTPTH